MEKRTKLGIAATSLAAAGTMVAPTTASADVIVADGVVVCDPKIGCPSDSAFIKIELTFDKLIEFVRPEVALKLEATFNKLEDIFIKVEF